MRAAVQKLFLKHALAWVTLLFAIAIAFATPWWWQKLATLPCASIVAVLSIRAGRDSNRLEAIAAALRPLRSATPGLVPYIDPVRASRRTGRIVYQFIQPVQAKGSLHLTTTLEQLIASFLQVGLAKIDTKLSAPTQQLIDSAVPTLVATIASVIVDLAENHKSTKAKVQS